MGKNIYPGWIIDGGLQSESYSTIYIAGLYYVMTTLTTVGYGDVPVTCNQERIFQIILLLLGTFAYSWLLTYISNYIKKNNEKYIVFEQNLKILEEIKINYPNLNQDLHDRIYRYLIYNKSKYNIDVKKKYRRKGFATFILTQLIANGGTWLWVRKNNKKAIKLYKKLGFKEQDCGNKWYRMEINK